MERDVVFFDLDGTLLPLDIDDFLKKYFKALSKEFSDVFNPDYFIKSLLKATNTMIENNGERLNINVFIDSFLNLMGVDNQNDMMKRFDKFYQEKFPRLGATIRASEVPADLIKHLKESGYQLVLATNAVFPLQAIKERMNWANVDPADFVYISCYENMHYCKPNRGFYQEILQKIDVEPERSMMIGNDAQEDMIAATLGMETYLLTDFLIDRKTDCFRVDWTGTMEELFSYLTNK